MPIARNNRVDTRPPPPTWGRTTAGEVDPHMNRSTAGRTGSSTEEAGFAYELKTKPKDWLSTRRAKAKTAAEAWLATNPYQIPSPNPSVVETSAGMENSWFKRRIEKDQLGRDKVIFRRSEGEDIEMLPPMPWREPSSSSGLEDSSGLTTSTSSSNSKWPRLKCHFWRKLFECLCCPTSEEDEFGP